jgi:integrase
MAKGRRIRHVDIPPNAVNWLSLISDRSGKVVEFRNKNHFDRMFRKLRGRAGFRKKNDKGNWVSTWNNNAIRHSFGTYHFALYGDPIKTAVQMGHKSDDQVLFDHYRALAKKEEGRAFFSIEPPKSESKLVEFAG